MAKRKKTFTGLEVYKKYLSRELPTRGLLLTQTNPSGYRINLARTASRASKAYSHNKLRQPPSIYDQWESLEGTSIFKLKLVILAYAFIRDDNIISWREKRTIRKLIRTTKVVLTQQDIDDIELFLKEEPTKEAVSDYMKRNRVPLHIVQKTVSELEKKLKYNQRYVSYVRETYTNYTLLEE